MGGLAAGCQGCDPTPGGVADLRLALL